jgi:hypothetical protein
VHAARDDGEFTKDSFGFRHCARAVRLSTLAIRPHTGLLCFQVRPPHMRKSEARFFADSSGRNRALNDPIVAMYIRMIDIAYTPDLETSRW